MDGNGPKVLWAILVIWKGKVKMFKITWTDVIAESETVKQYVIQEQERLRRERFRGEYLYLPISVPQKEKKEYTFQ